MYKAGKPAIDKNKTLGKILSWGWCGPLPSTSDLKSGEGIIHVGKNDRNSFSRVKGEAIVDLATCASSESQNSRTITAPS